jgi:hypothetical protein
VLFGDATLKKRLARAELYISIYAILNVGTTFALHLASKWLLRCAIHFSLNFAGRNKREGDNMDFSSPPVVAALVAGVVALITAPITAIVTLLIANRRNALDEKLAKLRGEFEQALAEQKARLDNRALFAAERVAHTLLMHPEWKSRTFRIIKARIGGFDDDSLRQILVRAGAIRTTGQKEEERWGLLERNKDSLGHAQLTGGEN